MPNMFTRVALTVLIVIIAMWIGAFTFFSFFPEENVPDASKDDGRITVVATIYPLAYLAMDLDPIADVTTIVGSGVEPHDYEPTISDVKQMQDAEILIFNGEIDEWAVQAIEDHRAGATIDILRSLGLRDMVGVEEGADPHIWLDPALAEEIVRRIGQQLAYVDPDRAEVIARNIEAKVVEIRGVDAAYRATLSNCAVPEIITAHDAFQYLANAYGFTSIGITGINPDAEPSAATVAEIVDLVRTHRVPTVFFEELTSDRLAKTIANETGATSEVLDAIESLTPGYSASSGYTEIMMTNLEKLKAAMVCTP